VPNDGGKIILGPDGRPVSVGPPGLVVLKISLHSRPPTQQLLQGIAQVTGSNVVVIPLDYEIVTGMMAKENLEMVHKMLHEVLDVKETK